LSVEHHVDVVVLRGDRRLQRGTSMTVTGKHFQLSLMLVGKARSVDDRVRGLETHFRRSNADSE